MRRRSEVEMVGIERFGGERADSEVFQAKGALSFKYSTHPAQSIPPIHKSHAIKAASMSTELR